MAQADPVPTSIPPPITGATSRASTNRSVADRRYLGSDAGIKTSLGAQRDEQVDPTEDQRWYQSITGRLPLGLYSFAVCYAIVAILLGWWRWNFLLLLLLFPIKNRRLRVFAFPAMRSNRFSKASCSRERLP